MGGPLYFKFIHIVFRTSWLQYKLYTWQRNICSYVWFSSSLNSKSDDHPLRCNFVEDIYKVHKKTGCNMEEIDDNTRKHIRMKKRMVKSMKVVSFILITLMISIIPSVVIGLKGVTSRLDILLIICFSVSNSVINPIIYCAQIDDLKKEIKTMFRIQT